MNDMNAFSHLLQNAYTDVLGTAPEAISVAEERLIKALEPNGVVLTSEVLRALAYALVEGRDDLWGMSSSA